MISLDVVVFGASFIRSCICPCAKGAFSRKLLVFGASDLLHILRSEGSESNISLYDLVIDNFYTEVAHGSSCGLSIEQ